MKSMFQRFGTQPMKFTFTLEVHDINLPLIRGLNEGDLLHFSLERGSKSVEGEEVKAGSISSIGDMKTVFNQTLTIGVTLYKDSKGKFQEKLGTLSLKQRKKGVLGKRNDKEAFKIIGVVPLELHMLTERHDEEFEAPLMMGGRDGAVVNYKLIVLSGGLGRDDDDSSSVNSSTRNSVSAAAGAKGSLLKGKNNKKVNNGEDDDDDDWKADFSNNKNHHEGDDDDIDPFDVPNPFGDNNNNHTKKTNNNTTTTPAKSTASNPFDMNDSNSNTAAKSSNMKSKSTPTKTTTSTPNTTTSTTNKKDMNKYNAEKEKLEAELEEELMLASLSPDAQDWQQELNELILENQALKDREANLVIVTEKADFFSKEAQKLEELLRQLKIDQDRLHQQKQEVEAELKGRLAENEILIQEVIMTKLALVEVSTELDVMKKNCAQLKNKLGLTNARMTALEVNGVKSGSERGGGGGRGGGQQQPQQQQQYRQQSQQQQQQYNNNGTNNNNNNNNRQQQQQQQNRNSDDNYKMQQQQQQQQQMKRASNRNNNY